MSSHQRISNNKFLVLVSPGFLAPGRLREGGGKDNIKILVFVNNNIFTNFGIFSSFFCGFLIINCWVLTISPTTYKWVL